MTAGFTADEIATIRKLFAWIEENRWLDGYKDGLTGANDEGIAVTEYSDDGYGSTERDTTYIPWLALADPAAYQAELDAEKAERRREEIARQAVAARQREAQERAVYESLKQKFG